MYGSIFAYIWLIFIVNVGKYTIHGSYGIGKKQRSAWNSAKKIRGHFLGPGMTPGPGKRAVSENVFPGSSKVGKVKVTNPTWKVIKGQELNRNLVNVDFFSAGIWLKL